MAAQTTGTMETMEMAVATVTAVGMAGTEMAMGRVVGMRTGTVKTRSSPDHSLEKYQAGHGDCLIYLSL